MVVHAFMPKYPGQTPFQQHVEFKLLNKAAFLIVKNIFDRQNTNQ